MTTEQQSQADRQTVSIRFLANGYCVNYYAEQRVYQDEKEMLDEITAYVAAFRSSRPKRTFPVPPPPTISKA